MEDGGLVGLDDGDGSIQFGRIVGQGSQCIDLGTIDLGDRLAVNRSHLLGDLAKFQQRRY